MINFFKNNFSTNLVVSIVFGILLTIFFYFQYDRITRDTSLRTYIEFDCKIKGGYNHLKDSYVISYFSALNFIGGNNFNLKGFERLVGKNAETSMISIVDPVFGSSFIIVDKPYKYFEDSCFINNDVTNVLRNSLKFEIQNSENIIVKEKNLLNYSFGRRDVLGFDINIKDSKIIIYSTFFQKDELIEEVNKMLPGINFRLTKLHKELFKNKFNNLLYSVKISTEFRNHILNKDNNLDINEYPETYKTFIKHVATSQNQIFLDDFSKILNSVYDSETLDWKINLYNQNVIYQNLDNIFKKYSFLTGIFIFGLTFLFFLLSFIHRIKKLIR